MTLNPQHWLDHLISCRRRYEQTTGDRTDAEHRLRQAIMRAEIESGNLLGQVDHDPDIRGLYNRLLLETEMSKGVIEQRTPTRR